MELMRKFFRKPKPRVPNPPPAAVTIMGFNVRNVNRRRRSPNVKPKKSALRINLHHRSRHNNGPRNYSNLSKNELQRLINSGANNRNELEKLWIKKAINQNSFHNLRRFLNSGAFQKHTKKYIQLENAWFNKLIRYGTNNNIQQAINSNDSRYTNELKNALQLRKIPLKHLPSLVNRVPNTTRMGKNTARALRFELERRGAN